MAPKTRETTKVGTTLQKLKEQRSQVITISEKIRVAFLMSRFQNTRYFGHQSNNIETIARTSNTIEGKPILPSF